MGSDRTDTHKLFDTLFVDGPERFRMRYVENNSETGLSEFHLASAFSRLLLMCQWKTIGR